MRLPELPPRIGLCLDGARGVNALGIGRLHDPACVVAQLGHSEGIVGLDQDVKRLFECGHTLVIGQRGLRAANGCHISAALEVIAGDVHLILASELTM